MKRTLTLMVLLLSLHFIGKAGITLDYCLKAAENNYPTISKYGLLEQSAELNLAEINRSWLPNIGLSAQGTMQNIVPSFPAPLRNILSQNGLQLRGMSKLQYKVAAELNQTIWDGGRSKASRAIERAVTEETKAALDVEMYALRSQVESLFFGILLMQEQIQQTESNINLLETNLKRLNSMVSNGTAMQSDADMVEAQKLTLEQNLELAQSAMEEYKELLMIYIGEEVGSRELTCPETNIPEAMESSRPELTLFDKRADSNMIRKKGVEASVMPYISFFTQAYYGYPGFNYFESMSNRTPSFNIMAGIKLSWNTDALYTKNIKNKKLSLESETINVDRDTFLFNTRLQTSREKIEINSIREVMKEDSRIVELRKNVRMNAEAQLRNGIIDATGLLSKINDENQARLNAAYHRIQLIQNIYKLKNTLNR